MVICDGMGDRPSPEFGNKTPLSYAKKPNLDALANLGAMGLMDPIAPGICPGSDVATLALLGYDPRVYYTGRGALEALGAGVDLNEDDVAFRCNFATIDDSYRVIDRRAGRISEGVSELAESLNKIRLRKVRGLNFRFIPTIQHRGVLIFRGEDLSARVTDIDPHKNGMRVLKSIPLSRSPGARRVATAVNEFVESSIRVLSGHPVNVKRHQRGLPIANIVLPRGAGKLPKLESLEIIGLKGVCVAAVALVRGVSKASGLRLLDVPGATGGPDTNFKAKMKAAIEALHEDNFVLLHFKATDVLGHDRDFLGKVEAIQKIDESMGLVRDMVDAERTLIVVTADHCTPISIGDHSGDPAPLLIHGCGVDPSGAPSFDERNAARGDIGRIRSLDLMPMILDLLGKGRKFESQGYLKNCRGSTM
jgi:2,3-bisphosphoglycerate-independent phosphoglycerate mutase